MKKIAKNLIGLIGHTPLMELSGYSSKHGLAGNIVAKLEAFNPAGSVKDRVALSMIEDAEERGILKPGATIIELFYLEDLSLNKVSEIMNMPSGTVKSHLSRARQRLNVYLDKEDYKYGE